MVLHLEGLCHRSPDGASYRVEIHTGGGIDLGYRIGRMSRGDGYGSPGAQDSRSKVKGIGCGSGRCAVIEDDCTTCAISEDVHRYSG